METLYATLLFVSAMFAPCLLTMTGTHLSVSARHRATRISTAPHGVISNSRGVLEVVEP
jgi:hypothetical protein